MVKKTDRKMERRRRHIRVRRKVSGTAERHPAQHSAGCFHGLLHVAGQSCTSAGHRNAGHSDPDRCSGVSGRFCTAEAGYV